MKLLKNAKLEFIPNHNSYYSSMYLFVAASSNVRRIQI